MLTHVTLINVTDFFSLSIYSKDRKLDFYVNKMIIIIWSKAILQKQYKYLLVLFKMLIAGTNLWVQFNSSSNIRISDIFGGKID